MSTNGTFSSHQEYINFLAQRPLLLSVDISMIRHSIKNDRSHYIHEINKILGNIKNSIFTFKIHEYLLDEKYVTFDADILASVSHNLELLNYLKELNEKIRNILAETRRTFNNL